MKVLNIAIDKMKTVRDSTSMQWKGKSFTTTKFAESTLKRERRTFFIYK